MAEINTLIDSDDEDNLSVHSAISNPSDFAEDEEVDYLALELLHHLPADKADKLMKSLRAKEKAVQDLVTRNRSLLNSCQALDEENQALTDRLKEAEVVGAKVEEVKPPAPSAPVDNSIFLQMERGKEETILRLTNENRKLMEQVKRLGEHYKQMEEALVQTRKEIKRAQSGKEPQVRLTGSSTLDEEERIYRELQGESMGDLIMQKLQEKQAEQRIKIQKALQASLAEEIGRIESWGSDVKGVLLAVDGLEAQLKHQLKEPKGSKKAKAVDTKAQAAESKQGFTTEHITTVSAQLLDEFDGMKGLLEVVDKEQLSLEQTVRAASDSAEPLAVTLDLDSGLAAAESEAEWLREHNAAWVNRCQSLSLQPMLEVLQRTDSAFTDLLAKAPPGLMPTNVEDCLQERRAHMKELSEHLQAQMASIADLQEESAALGRTVRSLQAAQKSHRSKLRQNMSESVKRLVASFEHPLDDMRSGLRQHSQALSKARSQVAKLLDDLAASTHRAAVAQGPSKDLPGLGAELQEFIMSEIRQVRSMGKQLVTNLEEGCKAVEKRMHQVIEAVSGEAAPGASGRPAVRDAGDKDSHAEAKKKRKKKGASGHSHGAAKGKEEEAKTGPPRSQNEPPNKDEVQQAGLEERQKSSEAEGLEDADAQLRAEFQEAFESTPSGSKSKKQEARQEKVLAGTDLLQELESLRSGTEALEARMAERLQARVERADGDDPDAAKPNPARRRKKMFV
ncbi:unnamed protein product [Durusdinium trenchii]|uniref:Uncharacterized protein n=1 Tax=Durusdinium trenchii TaxID=1381693 RepID=A0ABP0NJY4_9DINO